MSSFDLGQRLQNPTLIPPQAWDGGDDLETSDALAVDVAGAEGVAVAVNLGAITGANAIEIAFHGGDENDFTVGEASEIDEKYVINSPDMDDTENAGYIHSIKTTKRYLKVVVSRSGTQAAAISVAAILGHLSKEPA